MKHWIACWTCLIALFLVGCDTVNHSQLQIMAPKPERGATATVPASELETVKRVVSEIAKSLYFEDRTQISLTPGTITSWSQVDVKNPMSIKAWAADDRIAIEMFQRPPETGETAAYRRMRKEVMARLKQQFGTRLKLVHKMDHIKSAPGEL